MAVGVGDVDGPHGQAAPRHAVVQEAPGAVVGVAGDHHRTADRQRLDRGRYGRHTRAEGEGRASLEGAEDGLERLPGLVVVPPVDRRAPVRNVDDSTTGG